MYKWTKGIKPRHIHFEVQTLSPDLDTCAVHFYNLRPTNDDSNRNVAWASVNQRWFIGPPGPDNFERVPNQDVFLFRLGYFNYMKLNVEPMIKKSEKDKWYKIDLIIDWSEQ